MSYTTALGVLDAQADLLKWTMSPGGDAYIRGFAESMSGKAQQGKADERWLAGAVRGSVANGTPYWVAPDMVLLAQHAAESFEKDMLHPADPISPTGFLYLSEGILTKDARDKPVSLKAISWMPCTQPVIDGPDRHGVFVAWWSDVYDDRDPEMVNFRKMDVDFGIRTPRLLLLHYGAWWFDTPFQIWNPFTHTDESKPDEGSRFLFVAWTLMKQRLASGYDVKAPKHFSKRATKAGLTEVSNVRIITLRRTGNGNEEEPTPGSTAWSHRWLVGGHWRWQWYPSLETHKQIWIEPYVKGPDSKPLVAKTDVFAWKR